MLNILIPTYNRKEIIKKNITLLSEIIRKANLYEKVEIIVSDNNSSDGTFNCLKKLKNTLEINLKIFKQDNNIGLEKNSLFLLKNANKDFVMFLGDDDFLSQDLLEEIIKLIKSNRYDCIIPKKVAIDTEGKIIIRNDIKNPEGTFESGFLTLKKINYLCHSMAGLTFRKEMVYEKYIQNKVSNLYPFVFFGAINMLRGNTIILNNFPVYGTIPYKKTLAEDDVRDWNYGQDGLVSDFFDNYNKIPELNYIQRVQLQLRLLDQHSFRYNVYLIERGFKSYFKALFSITFGKNTKMLTSVLFPIILLKVYTKYIIKKIKKRRGSKNDR